MVVDNSINNAKKESKPRFITVKQLCDYIGNDVIKPYSIYELIKKTCHYFGVQDPHSHRMGG